MILHKITANCITGLKFTFFISKMSSQLSTWRKVAIIASILFIYIMEGINNSVLGPFFPGEAKNHKGSSSTEIGLVTSMFDCAIFLTTFLLASIINRENQTRFYLNGILVSAVGIICFGMLGFAPRESFIGLCFCTRAVMGFGASMVYSTGVPLSTQIFPEYAGRVTSLVQTSLGLGMMLGPTFGSVLYALNGYYLPFIVSGVIELAVFFICYLLIPNQADYFNSSQQADHTARKPKMDNNIYFKYITSASLILSSLPLFIFGGVTGVRDAAFGLYFEDYLGLSPEQVGFAFLPYPISYTLTAPFYGYLIDKGYAGRILGCSSIFAAVELFLLYLPEAIPDLESIFYIIAVLILMGNVNSSSIPSCYLVFEKAAQKFTPDRSQAKIMAASWLTACRTLGRVFGSFIIGGALVDAVKFHKSCLIYSVIAGVMCSISIPFLFKQGFCGMVLYNDRVDLQNKNYEIVLEDDESVTGNEEHDFPVEDETKALLGHTLTQSDNTERGRKKRKFIATTQPQTSKNEFSHFTYFCSL